MDRQLTVLGIRRHGRGSFGSGAIDEELNRRTIMEIALSRDTERLVRFAAARLKEKSGINIDRLAREASEALDIEDTAWSREAIIANWDRINVDAGLGVARRVSPGA